MLPSIGGEGMIFSFDDRSRVDTVIPAISSALYGRGTYRAVDAAVCKGRGNSLVLTAVPRVGIVIPPLPCLWYEQSNLVSAKSRNPRLPFLHETGAIIVGEIAKSWVGCASPRRPTTATSISIET